MTKINSSDVQLLSWIIKSIRVLHQAPDSTYLEDGILK